MSYIPGSEVKSLVYMNLCKKGSSNALTNFWSMNKAANQLLQSEKILAALLIFR